MAATRAFQNLASLRSSFDEPLAEEESSPRETPIRPAGLNSVVTALHPPSAYANVTAMAIPATATSQVSPITGKVDRRRLRKVLKTPAVSLSVEVREELHSDVGMMLFARKSTWIALLDELLTDYVSSAKAKGKFPK